MVGNKNGTEKSFFKATDFLKNKSSNILSISRIPYTYILLFKSLPEESLEELYCI